MAATVHNTFKADLKKMLPVIVIILVTAFLVILSLRFVGVWHLERALYSGKSSSDYAEIYYVQGWRDTLKIRELAAAQRLEKVGRDSRALDSASLGSIKGNETLNKAIENINKALQVDASHKQSHRLMSMLQWYEGNEAQSYIHLAEYYRLGGLDSQALTAYQMALKIEPGNNQALTGYILSLTKMDLTDRARDVALDNSESLLTSPRGKFTLGIVYRQQGDLDRAENLLREAMSEGVFDEQLLRVIAEIAMIKNSEEQMGDFFLDQADQLERSNVMLFHLAAYLYRKVQILPKEETALVRALELSPNNATLRFELSVCYYKQDKFDEAKREFDIALQIDFSSVMQKVKSSGVDPRKGSSQ